MPRSHRTRTCLIVSTLALAFPAVPSVAQEADRPPAAKDSVQTAEPRAGDVESIDAIIAAVYDVISGPADEQRDWDRFFSLFVKNARLIPTAQKGDGTIDLAVLSPQEYAQRADVFFKQRGGFFESEIGRQTDRYGNIAHVFSSYASFHEDVEEPFMRGINSFQLVNFGDRWAIVTILWEAERPENPIPPMYLFESDSE